MTPNQFEQVYNIAPKGASVSVSEDYFKSQHMDGVQVEWTCYIKHDGESFIGTGPTFEDAFAEIKGEMK